jgi:hypothetical protein
MTFPGISKEGSAYMLLSFLTRVSAGSPVELNRGPYIFSSVPAVTDLTLKSRGRPLLLMFLEKLNASL